MSAEYEPGPIGRCDWCKEPSRFLFQEGAQEGDTITMEVESCMAHLPDMLTEIPDLSSMKGGLKRALPTDGALLVGGKLEDQTVVTLGHIGSTQGACWHLKLEPDHARKIAHEMLRWADRATGYRAAKKEGSQ